jgi:hypothetical protein
VCADIMIATRGGKGDNEDDKLGTVDPQETTPLAHLGSVTRLSAAMAEAHRQGRKHTGRKRWKNMRLETSSAPARLPLFRYSLRP